MSKGENFFTFKAVGKEMGRGFFTRVFYSSEALKHSFFLRQRRGLYGCPKDNFIVSRVNLQQWNDL